MRRLWILSKDWRWELALDPKQWMLGFNWFHAERAGYQVNVFLGPLRLGYSQNVPAWTKGY